MSSLPAHRHPQWALRLARLFESRWGAPLAWGRHDCCLFAADAVQACTGHDPAADLRGTYHTEQAARRLLVTAGGLAQLATDRAGPPIPASYAAPGDIGLLPRGPASPAGAALVVCAGGHWLGVGLMGLVSHHASSVQDAWRCTAAAAELGDA